MTVSTEMISTKDSTNISEFCWLTGIQRTRAYTEIKSGRLRSFKVGRSRRISRAARLEWLDLMEKITAEQAAA